MSLKTIRFIFKFLLTFMTEMVINPLKKSLKLLKKTPENHFFSFSSGLKTVISLNLGLTRGIYTPVNTQTDRDREIKWVTFLFHDKTAPIKKKFKSYHCHESPC